MKDNKLLNPELQKLPYKIMELNKLATTFKWKSETMELPFNMELLIRLNGSIGYCISKKLWVVGSWNGLKDNLNRFTTYIGKTLATEPETFELNRNDVIVCANNPLFASDEPIVDYMERFKNETDLSIYYQLVNSRNIPWVVAETDKMKKQIEKAIEDNKAGKPVVVTTSLLSELQTLDITEKDAIEKMQYLSSFYNELEKRNANVFGIDLSVIDKRAQVNSDEINQFDDVTSINFLSNYECRLNFCEEMKKHGFDVSVVRNPIFADEPTKSEIDSEKAQEKNEKEENSDVSNNERNE